MLICSLLRLEDDANKFYKITTFKQFLKTWELNLSFIYNHILVDHKLKIFEAKYHIMPMKLHKLSKSEQILTFEGRGY